MNAVLREGLVDQDCGIWGACGCGVGLPLGAKLNNCRWVMLFVKTQLLKWLNGLRI